MVRPLLVDDAIRRGGKSLGLHGLLQGRLGVGKHVRAVEGGEAVGEEAEDGGTGGAVSLIEEDRADERLQRCREVGRPLAPSPGLLAPAHAEHLAQADIPRRLRERGLLHQRRAGLRQSALRPAGVCGVQFVGDGHANDRVSEELKTLVRLRVLAGVLIEVRAVHQRETEQPLVPKPDSQRLLQLSRTCHSNSLHAAQDDSMRRRSHL